jgi:hypothetical protein
MKTSLLAEADASGMFMLKQAFCMGHCLLIGDAAFATLPFQSLDSISPK